MRAYYNRSSPVIELLLLSLLVFSPSRINCIIVLLVAAAVHVVDIVVVVVAVVIVVVALPSRVVHGRGRVVGVVVVAAAAVVVVVVVVVVRRAIYLYTVYIRGLDLQASCHARPHEQRKTSTCAGETDDTCMTAMSKYSRLKHAVVLHIQNEAG